MWGWLRDWWAIHAAHKQRELPDSAKGGQKYREWKTDNPSKANSLFPKDVGAIIGEEQGEVI